jgi:hypothetical protein
VHAYADDTQLYLSFKPDGATNELDVICALQNCIKDIRTWMTVDKLKLNDGKTEFLIIGTAAQLKKVNISSIVIGQDNVPVVLCARNLGVWFDNNLNMSHHINKTCQSVVYHLHNIRCIRKFLSYEDRKSVVQALIMSRIDYCNSLLFDVTDVHLSKLQRLQNTAARLICSIPKHDHITLTLIKLTGFPFD